MLERIFPPHATNVSALPGETPRTPESASFHLNTVPKNTIAHSNYHVLTAEPPFIIREIF